MSSEGPPSSARPRTTARLTVAVALVTICWIVGNPRSSGPDEPSHMVASAGLVRLQGDGTVNDGLSRLMDVPQMVGAPDPVCWAFVPTETVGCADEIALSDDIVSVRTTSFDYPPWGLVLPGLASFVPWPSGYAYLARALSSALPVLLVGLSFGVLAGTRRVHGAAALLGITPIVWFTFGTVNPSALAIGGGLALWTGLLLVDRRDVGRADLLAVAGWAAVLLPRRDGALWATLTVVVACGALRVRPTQLWHLMRPWVRWAAVAVAPLPVIQVLWRGDLGFDLLLALAPLALVAVELLATAWDRTSSRAERLWLGVIVAGFALVATILVVLQRPGGYDPDLIGLVVGNTGDHLTQLVGVLGWLNAPVPASAVLLYWVALGALLGVGLLERSRSVATAAMIVGSAIVVAWLLELGQGSDYGNYWQGRYTMPLAIGLPLVASWGLRHERIDDLAVPLAGASWIVVNLGFFAAQRRWAVGNDGTWYVWRWNTWDAPLHPILLMVAHGATTLWLAYEVAVRPHGSSPSHRGTGPTATGNPAKERPAGTLDGSAPDVPKRGRPR